MAHQDVQSLPSVQAASLHQSVLSVEPSRAEERQGISESDHDGGSGGSGAVPASTSRHQFVSSRVVWGGDHVRYN